MKIILPYSPWWLLLFAILSIALALLLYFKNPYDALSKPWKNTLIVTRSIVFFLLFFLLLTPYIQKNKKIVYPPEIILLVDNSQSITVDNSFNEISTKIKSLTDKYSKNYIWHNYSFSNVITNKLLFTFDGKATNLYDALQLAINKSLENDNIRAIILVSDGINTQKQDPRFLFNKFKNPIYTIGLGDTTTQTDLQVSKIQCNEKIPIGSNFPIEIILNAKKAKGKTSKLQIFIDDELWYSENINITHDNYSKILTIQAKAEKEGIHKIKVTWQQISEEKNIKNNNLSKSIEVVKQKYKIGILACATHPDIGAINRALSSVLLNEVQLIRPGIDPIANDLDVLIIYQLNSACINTSKIEELKQSTIPIWLFIGTQTQLPLATSIVPWIGNLINSSYIESQVKVNEQFPLFQIANEELHFFEQAPPIITLYPRNRTSIKFPTIFYQKIGTATTTNPVMFFYQSINKNIAVFNGEGIWRWRIESLRNNNNNFDTWVIKVINYLLTTTKEGFKIIVESVYQSVDPINIYAELINPSGELINTPEIQIIINSNQGYSNKYLFSRSGNGYSLQLGQLPPGVYNYSATVLSPDFPFTAKGFFIVEKIDVELQDLTANHDLLKEIANASGGKFLYFSELDSLEKILKSQTMSQKYYTIEKITSSVIGSWIYLVIITLLLGFEWFIRKYMGGY